MYADDTILITDSEENVHNSIPYMDTYCSEWKLTVNESKRWSFL